MGPKFWVARQRALSGQGLHPHCGHPWSLLQPRGYKGRCSLGIDVGPQPWPCPLHLADHPRSLAESGPSPSLVQCKGCLGQIPASSAPISLLTSSMFRLTIVARSQPLVLKNESFFGLFSRAASPWRPDLPREQPLTNITEASWFSLWKLSSSP